MIKKIVISALLLLFIAPFVAIYLFYEENIDLTAPLIDYHPEQTTRIYDRDNHLIANIFSHKHRYYAPIQSIPPRMIEALLAIEDTIFFEHNGVNVDAIFRALFKDIKAGGMVEGASTLTQQLIKNTLLTRDKKISRKVKELLLAIKLEQELTKEQILERYFNEIYLGHGYYGVLTASLGYFHKELNDLTLKEMAMLVGLPKAPSYYAPTKHYEHAIARANRVISRMYALGWIDENMKQHALQERPTVYNETLTKNRAPYVVDEVLRQLKPTYADIKTGGYIVHTTIDLQLQGVAKDALNYAYNLAIKRAKDANDYNETNMSKLNGALVSIDSHSGDILALVGGVDYKKSAYNRATQGRRQPGSAFKPFIYQVALDLGYSGASELIDISRTYKYEKDGQELKWKPKNYEGNFKGLISLREALVHSRNLATINLVTDIGLRTMRHKLQSYDIASLPNDLSLSLGSISLSVLQLAYYYTIFSNEGTLIKPKLIRSIEQTDKQPSKFISSTKAVTSKQQSFIMTTILRDVIRGGTGRRSRVHGIELAGKTGTTNNAVDAWFAGYSPSVETVVWFGNDDNTPMRKKETGGRVASPAFAYYYQKLLQIHPEIERKFIKPEGIIETTFNGKKEFFSATSKVPQVKSQPISNEELLF